jgi:hypothetical protein
VRHRQFYAALAVYLSTVLLALLVGLSVNEGHFVYALDDPYIHMTMARNLVEHGHFAANGMNFTSASSSPLWVLLIAVVYYFFGIGLVVPFILNLSFQILCLVLFYYVLRQYNVSHMLFALLGFILLTPLPVVLFAGMEHSAHIFFALIFLFLCAKLAAENEANKKVLIYLVCIAPVLTSLRYEGMYLVSIASLLLLLRKNVLYAMLVFAAGTLPIIVYGIVSTSNGWLFLPNTLLLKSSLPDTTFVGILRFCFKAFKNITEPHIFLVLVISLPLFVYNYTRHKTFWSEQQIFLLIAAFTTIINVAFVPYSFFRYDAYLMAMSVAAIAISADDLLSKSSAFIREKNNRFAKYAILALCFVLLSPFALRIFTNIGIPEAMREYHNQHYLMSQFVVKYIPDVNIAANDVGMLGYYSNGKVIDLWGVADMGVAKAKLNKSYNTNTIIEISRSENVKLAILYEHWFDEYGGLPDSWRKIGEWTITGHNFYLGAETVSFFSTSEEHTDFLRRSLKEFSQHLPKSIIFKIF